MGRSKTDGKLFDALAITDTDPHASEPINDIGVVGSALFAAENGLDDDVSLQYQGSFDNTNWHNIGSAVALAADAKAADTISDPWPWVRCVATAAVAPTDGTLTIWYSWVEDR